MEDASRDRDVSHWSSRLPLPPLFEVLVVHKSLSKASQPCVVSELVVEEERASRCRRVLDRAQLYVGETYLVQVGCSVQEQARRAARRLRTLMAGKAVHFHGAGESGLAKIEDAWSVDYRADEHKRDELVAVFRRVQRDRAEELQEELGAIEREAWSSDPTGWPG